MTVYAQDSVDVGHFNGDAKTPPEPPPRYDSGGITVRTSTASGSRTSGSQTRQMAPSGYSYGSYGMGGIPAPPPVYPQRPEGNIGKQVGHVCVTYSNVNHEMPHPDYMKMDAAQQRNFHQYGPPMMGGGWHPWGNVEGSAGDAGAAETKGGDAGGVKKQCVLCKVEKGPLKAFEHSGMDWVTCMACAGTAFEAEGVHLWRKGTEI